MQTESQTSEPPTDSTAAAPASRMASQPAFPLSPLDHIMPRRYTFRLLFFPTGNRDPLIITATLKAGLTKTLETLPLLSGTVKPYPCPLSPADCASLLPGALSMTFSTSPTDSISPTTRFEIAVSPCVFSSSKISYPCSGIRTSIPSAWRPPCLWYKSTLSRAG